MASSPVLPDTTAPAANAAPVQQAWQWVGNSLHCEGVALESLARTYGTPLYVYSLASIRRNYGRLAKAFAPVSPMIAYSVKANSNLALIRALANEGSCFDIVSVGELERVLRAGVDPKRVIFAGVGKRRDEIARALQVGVFEFNIESPGEADLIDEEARALGKTAEVALRINPDVDAHTHAYISTGRKESKFGINMEMAGAMADHIASLKNVKLVGVHAHTGSQILNPTVHAQAVAVVEEFIAGLRAKGFELKTINMGGGFGIDYEAGEHPLQVERVADQIIPVVKRLGLQLLLEPGRYIVAPSGALLARVTYVKKGSAKTFVIVDAAMTELIRPALYAAHHRIVPVLRDGEGLTNIVDVVGPVCESSDFFAKDRPMAIVKPGEVVAMLDAGAYGMVMASNYNTRPKPAEVLVDGDKAHIIRERETMEEVLRHDRIPDFLK